MEKVYIVSAQRTAVGRFGGSLKQFSSSELCAEVIKAMVKDLKVPLEKIDEIIIGNVYQAGGKANPARQAALKGGLPTSIPAMTINKQCASGMRSVSLAYQQIKAGDGNLIIAGGTESMSNVPYISKESRWGKKLGAIQLEDSLLHDGLVCSSENYHMGVTAENVAEQYNISRQQQDEYALRSQTKAAKAIANGVFEKEIVPIVTKKKNSKWMNIHGLQQ